MTTAPAARALTDAVRDSAYELTDAADRFDPLIEAIGGARFVLIGEATHGTHEFYRERAELTKRLILEQGFDAVAAEADWPDAYRANVYAQHQGGGRTAEEALGDFKRFPQWMWRNTVVVDFIEWLRAHNAEHAEAPVGFYGLDLYSLHQSIEAVLEYLDRVDPEAAQRARYRYSCFEDFGEDPQAYGYSAYFGMTETCEDEAVQQLLELRERAAEQARRDGAVPEDDAFYAEQNARLVRNAERYYRTMFHDRASSWNVRDRHMAETLQELAEHLGTRRQRPAKVVVWAHNSHVGDARHTSMGSGGELNIGQLVRQAQGEDSFLVGLTTYSGTVTAASDWGAPAERKRVRPALSESYEALLHATELPRFVLLAGDADPRLAEQRLERAIGVIYRPQTERLSHYFTAALPRQFDAVMHFDETRALQPLETTAGWEAGELPETYPSGH